MSPPRHPARLLASSQQTPHLRHLQVEVPEGVRALYRTPGQFVEVGIPGILSGSFFAIASAPGEGTLELLVKSGSPLADELWGLSPGDPLLVSDPMGPGFPIEGAKGRDVLLFATGSGFAPIRAMLRVIGKDRGSFGAVHLFFGVRTEEDFPFREELDALPAQGISVHLTVSRRPDPASGHGRYVQERFRSLLPPVEHAVAFLCGIEGMVEGVTQALVEAGMGPERISVNL